MIKRTLLLLLILVLIYGCPTIPTKNNCSNGIFDEGEIGVDCGGECPDCFEVITDNELAIKHLKIVNSPEAKSGPFSFGKLMFNLAGQDSSKTKVLIESLFRSWDTDQTVNGFVVPARPQMSRIFLEQWMEKDNAPNLEDWKIQFENAPLRLLAITNRIDLNNQKALSAGEGRLTFGQDDGGNNDFTLILEYNINIPTRDSSHVLNWANRWHQLSKMDKESNEYKDSLVAIVETFSKRDIKLNALRTNSILGNGPWEFREFNIEAGKFVEKTRKNNPDISLNGTSILANYLSHPEISVELADSTHSVRDSVLAGNTQYGLSFTWNAPNIPAEHLKILDFISCTGCHGGFFPGTGFTHIKPRAQDQESDFSPFMDIRLDFRRKTLNSLLRIPPSAVVAASSPLDNMFLGDSISIAQIEEIEKYLRLKTTH